MVRSPLQSPILKSLLNNVYNWWIKNEMTFGISKCFTLVEEMQESALPISYLLRAYVKFFTNVMPIVISDFYTMINLYTNRPAVVKSDDIKTIRIR
ncbi:hypothetical protein H8356DRAFT_1417721 [Neocallimastix lanati (nom. inval.)]|nr:hypothetical protein H8356DRAFT_1417721 [Neocallimastix sp. JGI-2020a]